MPRGKWRAAIAGLGRIAWMLDDDPLREKPCTHAGAMRDHGGFEIVEGCDPDPARREAFGSRYGVRDLHADAEAMLDATKPDVLAIAAPPEAHEKLLRLAFARGVPVAVCEKPLANDLASVARIEAAAAGSRTRVVMNYERRFSRDWLWVRDRLRSGLLGALRSAHARVFMGKARLPSEVARHDATHMVDALRFVAGEALRVEAVRARDEKGGFLRAELSAGGVPALLEVVPGLAYLEFSLDLWCERGMISVGNGVLECFESRPSPHYAGFESLARAETPAFAETGYFRGVYAEVARLLDDPGAASAASLEDGIAAARLVEEMVAPGGGGEVSREDRA